MISKHSAFAVLGILGLVTLPCGCGEGTSLNRTPVHGTVKMASGEQINGSITFIPAGGHSGPSATTELEQGKYKFDNNNGPTAGPHTVIIKRIVSRTASRKPTANKPPLENGVQWTLSAEVSGDGKTPQDFSIDK